MNINIYDEASLSLLSTSNFHEKHTISSLNKQKYIKQKYFSGSELISQNEIKSQRVRPNSEMYQSGINFLKHKQEKQDYLSLRLEEEFKKKCTFQPQLSQTSRLLSARLNVSQINHSTRNINKEGTLNVDSQTMKLEQELIECTFSPKILKTTQDIFDRRKPMYERNVEWQDQVKEKQTQSQMKRESLIKSKITTMSMPKQMDLRAAHALKKNFSMKYLRKSMIG
ncbi:unnamed protein product (macronuclear) [Paramecium tetraurelia]|uniref:Uncharacterized protein n=1 Tax=Paramecium tetraurelia TaxID=5888 RepID=A0DWM1_PARTE|nr:uncharacterized protein GSPATT00021081001 [Paramecium tetraurelia]CAK87438.1 unnamed protein product [Paramecium tetraurelia]|eukprot:XP_001454835.1 hypothetical protein (macronuclear) [Paramecium tetraurelia strain d4-2]